MSKCNACGSSKVKMLQSNETIRYKGGNLSVAMDYSECEECKREFISKKQILSNEARIRAAKKEFDGLMVPNELKKARLALGLTQEQAANVFGGGVNAFSKYERGEVNQSKALDLLLKICLKRNDVFLDVLQDAGLLTTNTLFTWSTLQSNVWPVETISYGITSDADKVFIIKPEEERTSYRWSQKAVRISESNDATSGFGDENNVH